jgi:hypothetical protein
MSCFARGARPVAAMVEGASVALRFGNTAAGTLAIPWQKDSWQADDHPPAEPAVS